MFDRGNDQTCKISRRKFVWFTLAAGVTLAVPRSLYLQSAFAETGEADKVEKIKLEDSIGRNVNVPSTIKRVIPSGIFAQMVISTLSPEKLSTIADKKAINQSSFVNESIESIEELPKSGSLFGSGWNSIDVNAVTDAEPDLIVDVGNHKELLSYEFDRLETEVEMPIMFVDASFGNLPSAYRSLGKLLGCEHRAEILASYLENLYDYVDQCRQSVMQKKSVLYAEGETGLSVRGPQSFQAQAIEFIGAVSAASYEGGRGSVDVDFADVAAWNPNLIVFSDQTCFTNICNSVGEWSIWQSLPAIIEQRFELVPRAHYSWLGSPLCTQSIGLLWLGNLLYPDVFDYEISEKAEEFYRLFFESSSSDGAFGELLVESLPSKEAMVEEITALNLKDAVIWGNEQEASTFSGDISSHSEH